MAALQYRCWISTVVSFSLAKCKFLQMATVYWAWAFRIAGEGWVYNGIVYEYIF